jgi:predicted nucleic acid-binding Zn ribbon protein
MRKIFWLAAILVVCLSALPMQAPTAAAWGGLSPWNLHVDMTQDALGGLGLSNSDIEVISDVSGQVDTIETRSDSIEAAIEYLNTARSNYSSGGDWQLFLGKATHYIEDALCPAHVFDFQQGECVICLPPHLEAHTDFEYYTHDAYHQNPDYKSSVTSAQSQSFICLDDLRQILQQCQDKVRNMPCKYWDNSDPPKYIINPTPFPGFNCANGASPHSGAMDDWEMCDSDIEECLRMASSLVKGATIYVLSGTSAVDQGLCWLLNHQNPDGSWTYSGRLTEENVGLTAMATAAFLNHGVGESDPTVRKALDWMLGKQDPNSGSITTGAYQVYDTSLAIMALVDTGNSSYYNQIWAATNFLVSLQNDEDTGYTASDQYYGGWPYWQGIWGWADLSNSQFVLLALHYAEGANTSDTLVPQDVWFKAETFVQRCQNREASNPDWNFYDDGGFIYQPGSTIWAGGQSYASITMAGLWGFYCTGETKSDPRVQAAIGWLQNNYHIDQNYPIGQEFLDYYLYGLAKACVLWDITINGHDWYQEMASFLASQQQQDGHWPGTSPSEEPDNVATCWAILALETTQVPSGTAMLITVDSPADVLVTDPLGRHEGMNHGTGQEQLEIPGATYSGSGSEPQVVNIPDPIAGAYDIILFGTATGSFTLSIEGMVGGSVVSTASYAGSIAPAQTYESTATVSSIAGPITIDTTPPSPTNLPPVAEANGPYTVNEGSCVTLTGNGTDPQGLALTYAWDLNGDGVYETPGQSVPFCGVDGPATVPVAVQVCNSLGLCATDSSTVTINVPSPTAEANGPYTVNEGSCVILAGNGTDPQGLALTYAWDLNGDGVYETPGQSVPFCAVDGPKTRNVKLQVCNSLVLCAADSSTVTIANVAPTVGPITAPVNPVPVNTAINASASFTDPGVLDTHTAAWNWGDGASSAGVVTEINGSGSVAGSHTYATCGVYTITLTVTDKDGGIGTDTATVTVSDTTPPVVAIAVPTANAVLKGGVTLTAAASDLSGLAKVYFCVRGPFGSQSKPIGYENLQAILNIATGKWEYAFDTTQLPDGNYLVLAKAVDNWGNTGWSSMVPVNISNQAFIVTIQLKDSNGNPLSGGVLDYCPGDGTWQTIGTTDACGQVNMELPPRTVFLMMSYAGGFMQKYQDVGKNPVVVFQTTRVTMKLLDSTGTSELNGSAQYLYQYDAGGWTNFGSGTTTTTMELLPVKYTFKVSYAGASVQKSQDVGKNPVVVFQTTKATMKLLDSAGTTELNGGAQYQYDAGGWTNFGSGTTTTTMELLPLNYSFKVSYAGASVHKSQNVGKNPVVVFQTTKATMKLLDSAVTVQLNGGAQYQYDTSGWNTFGSGTTTTTMELLPLKYIFQVSYAGASVQKSQNVASNPVVVFQTGKVHSDSGKCTQYYAGIWRTFTQDMELLPVSYKFHFSDKTPDKSYAIVAGTIKHIH